MIDLTAGDGAVAMASLRAGCPYVGVTLTDTHATELRKHVHNTAFQAAATEGDDMYDADLVLALRGKSRKRMTLEEVAMQAAGTTHKKSKLKDDEASGGGGNMAKAKGKAKPKATAKKARRPRNTTRSMTMRLTRRLRRVTMMTGIVTATTTAKRKARRNELWGMLRAGSWRIVVGWSRSGGGHATGLEGTSSAQYSEIHTTGDKIS